MDLELMKRCFTEKEAAQYIGMSLSFLRKDRSDGQIGQRTRGPRHLKIGKCVRYLKDDLDKWLELHCCSSI